MDEPRIEIEFKKGLRKDAWLHVFTPSGSELHLHLPEAFTQGLEHLKLIDKRFEEKVGKQ